MSTVKKPLVSIVIPVYNGENFLAEAIDSALAQTYDNIEIIVVNDGSTDNGATERIALSYGDRIRYFRKENGGCSSALNFGISKMRGEYFSWLSHDDSYKSNKIEASIKAYEDNMLDPQKTVIYCKSAVINEYSKEIRRDLTRAKGKITAMDMLKNFFCRGNINGCALLIPKNILDATGDFSTEYTYILDFRYWVYIALKGYDYFEISENSVNNRRHKQQVSVKKINIRKEELKRFVAELIDFVNDDKSKLILIWSLCKKETLKGEAKRIEGMINIPLKARFIANVKWFISFNIGLLKRIYRKVYDIGSLN